ncbi:hypothetical protein EOA24_36485 [Mesorhizobium sp. M2A.F.Ca.ET.039.01.1.1]|nr:hypothetical protein EOA24_36485 [Mesorhizobium sp. M2A.F.Ca.ET.039.01.1.1]
MPRAVTRLATTDGDRPRDIRDRAVLMLLITYGLRAGEVITTIRTLLSLFRLILIPIKATA